MIKKIIIKDFKSIKDLELQLNPGVNVITGMNNSGKTNLMEAINVLVNDEYYPSKVSESFYFNDEFESDSFTIFAIVNIDSLDSWIKNSNTSKIRVWLVKYSDSGEKYLAKEKWLSKKELATKLINKDLTISKTLERNNAKQYKETICFKEEVENGVCEEFEFEAYSFLSLIYPGAGLGTDKSAKISLLNYKTSWFGKLIDSVIDENKKQRISKINDEIREKPEFKALEKEISDGFFGSEQNLIPAILGIEEAWISYIPSQKNIRTSFDVQVNDGKEEKIENKSTGTQFVTVIELFLNYIQKFNKNGILSIDEIESTLHPSIAKKVVSIASKKVKQLIFTTHSKDLLKIVPFANMIKVVKEGNETKANMVCKNPDKLYPLIYRWPELFFNDYLIVCEGKEVSLIEALIASNANFSKQSAKLNLDVINGDGQGVLQFINHASNIDEKIKCSFIYDAEYLDDKSEKHEKNYNITKNMMEFQGAGEDQIREFDSLTSFDEKREFLQKFKIFIMSKKNSEGKGGIELYYKDKLIGPQDKKERPLFLASELLQGNSIDSFFDSSEYIEVLENILKSNDLV